EQIARTLIEKLSAAPWLICTDQPSVLAVYGCTKTWIVHVHRDAPRNLPGAFLLGEQWVSMPAEADGEREALLQGWQQHGGAYDLLEPFERIHEALREAQRGMAA